MDIISKRDAKMIWNKFSDDVEAKYNNRVKVVFDYTTVNSRCRHFMKFPRVKHTNVRFGLNSIAERDFMSKDEFIWLTHQLVHEFGHVNQRMNTFKENTENAILMAKQQTICTEFPRYDKSSYRSQLVEIDAEKYSWQKTVELLSTEYPDLFTEDDVKQSLINGLYKYQGAWYANKNFSTWECGLKNLNEAFEQAKYKTWNVHTGDFRADADNSLAEKFESNSRLFEEYLHTFGSERNDLLFRYCVANDRVDTVKFSCLKKEVKVIKQGKRRLPDISNLECSTEDSKDNNGLSL